VLRDSVSVFTPAPGGRQRLVGNFFPPPQKNSGTGEKTETCTGFLAKDLTDGL
jgi:hypothetical protein